MDNAGPTVSMTAQDPLTVEISSRKCVLVCVLGVCVWGGLTAALFCALHHHGSVHWFGVCRGIRSTVPCSNEK